MMSGWYIYIFALLLGLVSYGICVFLNWKKQKITFQNYLFEGNNFIVGTFSIVGSIFSVAIFFTALSSLYILFGILALPIAMLSAILGLYVVQKKSYGLFQKSNKYSFENVSDYTSLRYQLIINSSDKPTTFNIFLLTYLFLMTTTEIAAFNNILPQFFHSDSWSPLVIYIVIFSVLSYVYISGFKGVLVTDTLQTVIIIISLVFMLREIIIAERIIEYHRFVKLPNVGDGIAISIGAFILCFTWFSSSPEIWYRINTLKYHADVIKTTKFSMLLLPIIFILSFLVAVLSGMIPLFHGNTTQAFEVWKTIVSNHTNVFLFLFLIIVVTAFFTTIDTYAITYSQITYTIQGSNILEKLLPKNVRLSTIVFIMICTALGVRLTPILNGILGVYAACLVIPMFIHIYVYPYLRRKNINLIPALSPVFHVVGAVSYTLFTYKILILDKSYAHLSYPLIPIYILLIEFFAILVHFITMKLETNK